MYRLGVTTSRKLPPLLNTTTSRVLGTASSFHAGETMIFADTIFKITTALE
jgi:hypothetical protein